MVVTIKCQSCGTSLKLREGFAKSIKEFKCLKCGALIPLQGSADSAAPASSPAAPAPKTSLKPMAPLKPVAPPPPAPDVAPGTIAMDCTGCKRPMNLKSALAGKKIRCKECGAVSMVPGLPPAAPVPAAAPAPSAPPPPPPAPVPPTPKLEPKTVMLPVEAATPVPAVEEKTIVLPASAAGLSDSADDLRKAVADRDTQLAAKSAQMNDALLRAEKAENALRSIAGHHAVEKADLQHQIDDLKAKLAAASTRPSAPPTLAADLDRLVALQAESLKARVDEIKKSLA